MNATRIGPSLLAADFARLAEDIDRVERGGADFLHLDVMDGHFVPNISFGLPVVAAVRQTTQLELNTHLMLQNPLPFIGPFKEAGADSLVVHVEIEGDLPAVLNAIRQHGLQCGLAVSPSTPVAAAYPYLDELDSVLVMSVEPGFGGQPFQPTALDKIRDLGAEIECRGLDLPVGIDGGVHPGNAAACRRAGARCLVAGSAVFGARDPARIIAELRG